MRKDYLFEEWRDIKGYEGLYQVSNFGRVKSLNYRKKGFEKILSPIIDTYGYYRVHLSKGNSRKKYQIHRLVAEAFLPNPDNLPCVNHKDEDKSNNFVGNLEWCTVAYNNSYSKAKTVIQYTINGEFIKEWVSARTIERELGYDKGLIGKCCLGKKKTAYGFLWSYAA